MKTIHSDKLKLIISMTVFGTIGIVRKYIPYPSSVIALVRGFVGMACLAIIFIFTRKNTPKELVKKNLPILSISGVLIGSNWICLFEAYQYTTVSVATMCYYMAPVFVILASPIIFHEKLILKKGLCAFAALFGMVLVSGVLNSDSFNIKGILFGLAAAIMYATIIILNKFITGLSANDRTMFQLGFAAISLLPYVLLTEDITTLDTSISVIVLLAIAGIVHTGLAYAMYFGSINKLPAQTVALFSYIDPIVAVILSFTILKENLSILSIIGIVIVIGAMIISDIGEQ